MKHIKKRSHYRPGQAFGLLGFWGSQISRHSAHDGGKVVSPVHQLPLPPRKYSWSSFLLEAESTQGCSPTRRIMSMKNSNDTIGNRTCNLRSASANCATACPVWNRWLIKFFLKYHWYIDQRIWFCKFDIWQQSGHPWYILFTQYVITLILRRSPTGAVWFYTSTSNKRAAWPKLYTKSLTRDLKLMYSRLTLVRISINV